MTSIPKSARRPARAALATMLLVLGGRADALIDGLTGSSFDLTARQDVISTADGNSHYAWGYAAGAGRMQYPGPTFIVAQGATVTIRLWNELPVPVSIVFPGQQGVTSSGGVQGTLAREVPPGATGAPSGPVTYTFVAAQPGTYLYHSGSNPALQVDMGLVGAIVVRPPVPGRAYLQPGTEFDREHLFLLSEMDPAIHARVYDQVSAGLPVSVDTTAFRPTLWFINGRNAMDTMQDSGVPWLPTQPYGCLPRMHPGERLLMRMVNAGRDLHPFHHHANHALAIARDGRVLSTDPGDPTVGPDLATLDFTVNSIPGQTMDLVFEWTGKGLGWDVYGHTCDPVTSVCDHDLEPNEPPEDHGKPIPVVIPGALDLAFGPYYSGSPFLGSYGTLPAGAPELNASAGHFHMWHSHNEKEVTTDDIFPGGMMTMLVVEAPWVPIP
jgi:FtsP/CotA-like multicopper oxidase with cupredoxin domain